MFGGVSLAADMVYEGARSMYGPLLGALGASALVVGVVTGAGEAMALVLRFVFGPLADRTGRYWALTIIGYGLTAVCVPLLAVTPFLGGGGLAVGIVLILLERSGKAVRSPSKSALLAHVAAEVGRGRGFGVHKAMDQVGAFSGPLLVAAVLAVTGAIWPAYLVLVVPGVAAMILLAVLRARVPDPSVYDGTARLATQAPRAEVPGAPAAEETGVSPTVGGADGPASPDGPALPDPPAPESEVPQTPVRRSSLRGWLAESVGAGLPPEFFRYAAAASLTTGGLVTFGIISFHVTTAGLLPVAAVPLVYAAAMAVEALAALVVGWAYDRIGARVLYAVPVLVAVVPALALSSGLAGVFVGIAVWGFAFGVQDSTVKALVADLVDARRRATAYGVFAGIQGALAVAGGAVIGWLYEVSLPALVVVVALSQALALVLLVTTLRRVERRTVTGTRSAD